MAEATEIQQLFARVFRGADGMEALSYLLKLNQPRGQDGLDALKLAHVEGQRSMVAHIARLVRQGQNPDAPTQFNGSE